MKQIKFGWAEESITPDKKVSLAGQFAERISEYVEKPITATALAVSNGDEQMILVSCDLVSVYGNLLDAVRDNLKDNTLGIDPMKIVMSAIHTHTGPVVPGSSRAKKAFTFTKIRELIEENLAPGRSYVEKENITSNPDIITTEETFVFLVERITKAILDAWNNLEDGAFVNAFGRAPVGMCRRAAYSDGSAQMWGTTDTAVFTELEGGNDSGIELMYIFGADKKLTGVIANLACPAQCVQHRLFVSPDFWGEVKVLLRKHFGEDLFVLAQCSAAGDQCPVDLIRWVEPYTSVNDPNIERNNPLKRKADPSMFDLDGMRKAGKRIANEIIEVYNEGLDEPITTPVFKHTVKEMQLPLRRVTLSDANAARKAIKDYMLGLDRDVDYNDVAKLQVHFGVLERLDLQNIQNILETEVHIMRLGNVAFASNPFELFLDYGNQIKARSHAEQTFLIQLANGSEGYLPTAKAERGGHYSAFVGSGKVGHVGGDQLVRETLEEINDRLFD
ncbi:MAG: hypothetical protein E7672_03965 [Ruminococcaceae bacterium]|nr:hypothetical protein [Oscillospiraceae bacterium]